MSDSVEERMARDWDQAGRVDTSLIDRMKREADSHSSGGVVITDIKLPFNTIFILATQIALAQAIIGVIVYLVLRVLDIV